MDRNGLRTSSAHHQGEAEAFLLLHDKDFFPRCATVFFLDVPKALSQVTKDKQT